MRLWHVAGAWRASRRACNFLTRRGLVRSAATRPQLMNKHLQTPHPNPRTVARSAAHPVRVGAAQEHPLIGFTGFTAIFAAAVSGYAGLGIWTIALTALALFSLSQAEYGHLYRRGRALGLTDITTSTMLQSACNAMLATTGAYAMGLVFRFI